MSFVLLLVAAPAQESVDRGKALYRSGSFEEAIAVFDTEPASVDAQLYAGFCHIALGNELAARERFLRALESEPELELPRGSSPKIVSAFARARAVFDALVVTPAEPFVSRTAVALTMRFRVEARNKAAKLRLCVKRESEVSCVALVSGVATVALAADVRGVDYFVTAARGAQSVAVLGSEDAPRSVALEPVVSGPASGPVVMEPVVRGPATAPVVRADVPVVRQWWLWTIVGAVVAGGIAAAIIVPLATAPRSASTEIAVRFE